MRRSCGASVQADREFDVLEDESDIDAAKARRVRGKACASWRAGRDGPDDGIGL